MFRFKRPLSIYLAACIALGGLTQSVQAAFVGAEQIAATATPQGETDRARIVTALDRPEVQAQLEKLGVDPLQARERVAALTDEEAAYLARHAATAPAGGDGGGIIGAILLVFFVLLLTDILGLTKIFPFTRPIR